MTKRRGDTRIRVFSRSGKRACHALLLHLVSQPLAVIDCKTNQQGECRLLQCQRYHRRLPVPQELKSFFCATSKPPYSALPRFCLHRAPLGGVLSMALRPMVDHVFGDESQTEDVYVSVGKDIVKAAMEGVNGTRGLHLSWCL